MHNLYCGPLSQATGGRPQQYVLLDIQKKKDLTCLLDMCRTRYAFSRSCSSIKTGKSCCRRLKPEQIDCSETMFLALHIHLTPHCPKVLETLKNFH